MKNKNKNENVVYVNGPEEAAKNNQERNKKRDEIKKTKTLILVLLVIGIACFIGFAMNRQYKGYKVLSSSETNYENTASYIQFGDNLLKYTPDGVSCINSNGDTVWSAGIDMNMPMAVASGNYAVVADMTGNSVCVFDIEGQISSLTMPYTIRDVDIANQGAFAVVLESEETNYINLYNKKGEMVYEIQTTIDKSGYPLDISISDDGQKLFTSYLNLGSNTVENNLAAYNFGDVGQNSNADRMVGGYKFGDEIIPKVEFIVNDVVAAFGTKTITVYSMKEKPSEKSKIEFNQEIRSVFYNEDYIGVILDVLDENTEHQHILKVYNLRGSLQFEKYVDFDYDNIYSAEKEIIISGGTECKIFRTNGSVKFDGELSGRIMSIVPSGKHNEYVVVYDNSTEIIKLKAEPVLEEESTEKSEE